MYGHIPVMLEETLQGLRIRPEGRYLDGTFGRGGHARSILSNLNKNGCLLVLDRDNVAIEHARRLFQGESRVRAVCAPFSQISRAVSESGLADGFDGILLDLGVSSPQLEDPSRGFSFQVDGPLDMRMGHDCPFSAEEWLGRVGIAELSETIRAYGEERYARRIARAIVEARQQQKITGTAQLSALIESAVPTREKGKHPATRTFQAIRMRINNELAEIEQVLPQTLELLKVTGRLAIISFHSLEDRLVKRFFNNQAKGDPFPEDLPVVASELRPRLRLVGRKQRAGATEVKRNPRSRSATLRVAEKVH